MAVWAIVGLGNPEHRYGETRHNIGFRVVNHLSSLCPQVEWTRECGALTGLGRFQTGPALLVKPQTYMNSSGEVVALVAERYRLNPHSFVVVYDDMDLELGALRIRVRGGHGGHRGMASVIRELGTEEIPRLRVGIGRPSDETDPVEYVLERFTSSERKAVEEVVTVAAEAVVVALTEGLEVAMSRFNGLQSRDVGADDP